MAFVVVVTDVGIALAGKIDSNVVADTTKLTLVGGYFRVGCLGHSGGTPDVPDPTLTDIKAATAQPTPETSGPDYWFQKTLTDAVVSDDGHGSTTVTCVLGALEANGQGGVGTASDLYEIGVYNKHGDLVAYGTHDLQHKTPGAGITNIITIVRGRP